LQHDTYTILHLTPWVRFGLVSLSAALAVLTLYLAHRAHKAIRTERPWRKFIAHLTIAVAAFWLFIWLSPQIYYLFYMACLPGLPAQVVVGWPPSPANLIKLLRINFMADLPPIAQGLLGWAVLGQAIWHSRLRPKRNRARS
jgi:hypothetical protein